MKGRALPKLTALESEILRHRLDVDDAIADALDEHPRETVELVCKFLLHGTWEQAEKIDVIAFRDVLQDAVEGSTFLWAASDRSDQKKNAIFRAGESLARKIGEFIGRKIEFPTY